MKFIWCLSSQFFYLFTYNEPPVTSIMYTYEKIEVSKDMTREHINHKI